MLYGIIGQCMPVYLCTTLNSKLSKNHSISPHYYIYSSYNPISNSLCAYKVLVFFVCIFLVRIVPYHHSSCYLFKWVQWHILYFLFMSLTNNIINSTQWHQKPKVNEADINFEQLQQCFAWLSKAKSTHWIQHNTTCEKFRTTTFTTSKHIFQHWM